MCYGVWKGLHCERTGSNGGVCHDSAISGRLAKNNGQAHKYRWFPFMCLVGCGAPSACWVAFLHRGHAGLWNFANLHDLIHVGHLIFSRPRGCCSPPTWSVAPPLLPSPVSQNYVTSSIWLHKRSCKQVPSYTMKRVSFFCTSSNRCIVMFLEFKIAFATLIFALCHP
jgi:hypothetical protein